MGMLNMAADMEDTQTEQSQPTASEAPQAEVESGDDDMNTEMMIKHPLQNQWTLWFYKPDRAKGWGKTKEKLSAFKQLKTFGQLIITSNQRVNSQLAVITHCSNQESNPCGKILEIMRVAAG